MRLMRLDRRSSSLPLSNVRIVDPFWSKWQQILKETTLEIEYQKCIETGRVENFRRAARGERGTFQGKYYNDSDVYKWVEAASYLLSALGPDARIEKRLDEVVAAIASAQMADGYIDTFFQVQHPHLRWRNLGNMHELYCMGHLIESAIAHHEATGQRTLIDVAIRVADHIDGIFGPGKRSGYCGHEEIELALIKLANCVAEPRYADLARWMIDCRGMKPSPFERELQDEEAMALSPWAPAWFLKDGKYSGSYAQDDKPLREQERVQGHAVRTTYLLAAATEAFSGRGDQLVEDALERLWTNLTERRMYLTGGIGTSSANEGFTHDYDLPNRTAYAETCAACGLIFWANRLVHMTGDAQYADVMERALYNGALSGISLAGDRFFYDNPLESTGEHHRVEWFECACCPPNIARLIASLGTYFVSSSEDSFWIHIPAALEAKCVLAGVPIEVNLQSNYPWDGEIEIDVRAERPAHFSLHVRIPGWCEHAQVELNDVMPEMEFADGYASLIREWNSGDRLKFSFDMPPRWTVANPKVLENAGSVALERGPLVYCLEECDLGGPVQQFAADPRGEVHIDEGPLEGTVGLKVAGGAVTSQSDELYQPLETCRLDLKTPTFVPYYAWDNREPGSMQVWLRTAPHPS